MSCRRARMPTLLPIYFHIMRSFVNSIIPRVSHRTLCWSRLWKIENVRNIDISSKVSQTSRRSLELLPMPTLKILTFGEKLEDDVILVQCPFKGWGTQAYLWKLGIMELMQCHILFPVFLKQTRIKHKDYGSVPACTQNCIKTSSKIRYKCYHIFGIFHI